MTALCNHNLRRRANLLARASLTSNDIVSTRARAQQSYSRATSSKKSTTVVEDAVKGRLSKVLERFDGVSIYNSQSTALLSGFARVYTLGYTVTAFFIQIPATLSDPSINSLWAPVWLVGGLTGYLMTVLSTAPSISNIRVEVPKHIASSQEALNVYFKTLPVDSKISIQHMRWLPWPTTSTYGIRNLTKSSGEKKILTVKQESDSSAVSNRMSRWLHNRLYMRYTVNGTVSEGQRFMFDAFWNQLGTYESRPRIQGKPFGGKAPAAKPLVVRDQASSRKLVNARSRRPDEHHLGGRKLPNRLPPSPPPAAPPPPLSPYQQR